MLCVTLPGLGHTYSLVPTAWALRAAGHDILWVASGPSLKLANAGFAVIDPAPDVNFGDIFAAYFRQRPHLRFGENTDAARFGFFSELYAEVSKPTIDETVAIARSWKPDIMLYSPFQAAGPLVAAVLGVPSLCHSFSAHSADPRSGADIARYVRDAYIRHDTRWRTPDATITIAPPSMLERPDHSWQVRHIPYNGGAAVPKWLTQPAPRPRIAVSLGSVLPEHLRTARLRPLLDAIGQTDADFILALNGLDVGAVPSNVHPEPWTPLSALLETCSAVVHHGGAGTTLAALDAALPQLVLPQGADQFLNARDVERTGVGIAVAPEAITPTSLHRLLEDEQLQSAAEHMAKEMHALPPPLALVPNIERLTRNSC